MTVVRAYPVNAAQPEHNIIIGIFNATTIMILYASWGIEVTGETLAALTGCLKIKGDHGNQPGWLSIKID